MAVALMKSGTPAVAESFWRAHLEHMRDLVLADVAGWAAGGASRGAYNHFSLAGLPSRYGQWGHMEHIFNTSTPKWCAVLDAVGAPEPAGCAGW